jgi:hypothetical protein
VVSTGEDPNLLAGYLIYESMFLIDAARPAPFEFMPKRFRFPDPLKGVTLNIFY